MAEALTTVFTVGELIKKLRQFPASAVLAIDVTPTEDAVFAIELDEDVATYADEEGNIQSGPMVILRVS